MDRIEKDFRLIFDAAMGNTQTKLSYDWVENLFESGTGFVKAYAAFWAAREHLCERFGLEEDDEDLELIMNGLLDLEEDLGRKMFFYGVKYAQEHPET